MIIQIREAIDQDAAALARLNYTVQRLHVEAIPERYKFTAPDDPQVIATFERLLSDEKGRIYIAEVEEAAAGYVYCKIAHVEENAFVRAYTTLHIDQMSVDETYQGKGVGHLLIERVFALAQQLELDVVTLGVMAFNTRAQRFYERHGFAFQSSRMIKKL